MRKYKQIETPSQYSISQSLFSTSSCDQRRMCLIGRLSLFADVEHQSSSTTYRGKAANDRPFSGQALCAVRLRMAISGSDSFLTFETGSQTWPKRTLCHSYLGVFVYPALVRRTRRWMVRFLFRDAVQSGMADVR